MPLEVHIDVEGGVVHCVTLPPGVTVTIRDYDIEGVEEDRVSVDEHGYECVVTKWEKSDA